MKTLSTPLAPRSGERAVAPRSGIEAGEGRTFIRPSATFSPADAGAKGCVAFLLLLLLSGCSFFSRSKVAYYSLDAVPGTQSTVRGTRAGIGTVTLPAGFDRREIVVRQTNDQLDVRSSDLWSTTLGDLVMHTLAFDLATRLPEGMMVLPGEAKPATPFRTVDVSFQDFAAGPGNSVVVDAHWILHDPGRADVAHHDRIAIDIPSTGSADVASGTSRALAALADRIAAALL